MRKISLAALLSGIMLFLIMSSCTTVNLTSWKDPASTEQIRQVYILALFEKLEFIMPFENNTAAYFADKGLTSVKSIDHFPPTQPFSAEDLKAKVSALGVDALLVFAPKGVDKSVNYTPPTYSGFYGYYRGGYYNVSPGYYSESKTYHIQANLYSVADEKLIWTGDLTTTDPGSLESAIYEIDREIYIDWVKNGLVSTESK